MLSGISDSLIRDEAPTADDINLLDGLEEVNLLEGLLSGPTFGTSDSNLYLPSIRLGIESRQNMFLLPPVLANSPTQVSPSPMTAVRKAHPTLRKSYRKTLQTASGFRVRMRTVFVPFVILPETDGTIDDLEEEKKQLAREEASSAEKTVVLCVEIENFGDMGQNTGFLVEKVVVSIAGEGAEATLIVWGDEGFAPDAAKNTFPLRIGRSGQYNLLYAVSFMRSPEEIDAFSFTRSANGASHANVHRAVTINVIGKPYFPKSKTTLIPNPNDVTYPTRPFSSRWNCVLDLSAQQAPLADVDDSTTNILPQPASPFPGYSAYSGTPRQPYSAQPLAPLYSATAGNRRLTLPGDAHFVPRSIKVLTPNKSPFVRSNDNGRLDVLLGSSRPSSQLGNLTPNSGAHYLRSPTTYSAPPPPPTIHSSLLPEDADGLGLDPPTTPAFPPFPPKSALPPTPTSLGPVSTSQGNTGPSVEVKRARGSLVEPFPATPLPLFRVQSENRSWSVNYKSRARVARTSWFRLGCCPSLGRIMRRAKFIQDRGGSTRYRCLRWTYLC